MKTSLTYTFDLPEDNEEYAILYNANSVHAGVCSFAEYLRERYKYEDLTAEQRVIVDEIRAQFRDEFECLLHGGSCL